jgi:hypothetical protein
MWIAGVMQGLMWRATNPDGTLTYAFVESVKATYPFYAIRFVGGLLFLSGMLVMAWNTWRTAAGAAVYLYTGNRAPTDLDLLVRPEELPGVAALFGAGVKRSITGWGELSKLEQGDIEVAGRLEIRHGGESWPYYVDDEMVAHLRTVDLDGLRVPALAPEDLIALKAVLQRGPEQGKHDLEDIEALAGRLEIDAVYLRLRLGRMGAVERARPVLDRWGW